MWRYEFDLFSDLLARGDKTKEELERNGEAWAQQWTEYVYKIMTFEADDTWKFTSSILFDRYTSAKYQNKKWHRNLDLILQIDRQLLKKMQKMDQHTLLINTIRTIVWIPSLYFVSPRHLVLPFEWVLRNYINVTSWHSVG